MNFIHSFTVNVVKCDFCERAYMIGRHSFDPILQLSNETSWTAKLMALIVSTLMILS
jgi:hypothetical protein